jgi:hypothetical protein
MKVILILLLFVSVGCGYPGTIEIQLESYIIKEEAATIRCSLCDKSTDYILTTNGIQYSDTQYQTDNLVEEWIYKDHGTYHNRCYVSFWNWLVELFKNRGNKPLPISLDKYDKSERKMCPDCGCQMVYTSTGQLLSNPPQDMYEWICPKYIWHYIRKSTGTKE